MKIIKRENDRLFQLLHQSCSEKCLEELGSASGPSTALLTGSSPAAQALRAPGCLEGATGWEETEVPVCTQPLPTTGTQLATSTPMEMSAYSMKAEEGFPHKNFMLMRQRKLKTDGKDRTGTSVQRTKLRSTNRKEGSYKQTIISLSIICEKRISVAESNRSTAIKGKLCCSYKDLVSLQTSKQHGIALLKKKKNF